MRFGPYKLREFYIVFYSKIKYGRNTGKTGGLTGMDTGKTVPQFHTDYLIRNIRFRFEFVHLKVETSSFLDSIDFRVFKVSL